MKMKKFLLNILVFNIVVGPMLTVAGAPVRVQLDAGNILELGSKIGPSISDGMGKVASNVVTKVITNSISDGASAFGNAINNNEVQNQFGKGFDGIGGLFNKSVASFSKAMNNDAMKDDIAKATKDLANTFGRGTETFRKEANLKLIPEMRESFRDFTNAFLNTHNVVKYGSLLAASSAISISGYYGTQIAWEMLKNRLLNPKPTVLLDNAKIGRIDRIKRWWNGYKTPEMIFPEEVKDRLVEISNKTKNIISHIKKGKKVTFDNLLLHGEPGTGKTLFAHVLADITNMDFAPTTAGALLQKDVGVTYINELMEMANHSKYGVIIFIDEADSLFVDRNSLNPDSEHYQVLNHLLALIGDGSNKFMVIAATNHSHIMDPAMNRRFQDRVKIPLPNKSTRIQLVDLYTNLSLFNEKENGAKFVEQAQKLVTPQVKNMIIEQTNGLSSAEIKDAIYAMRKKALATQEDVLTIQHINSAITEAIEKRKAGKEDEKKYRDILNHHISQAAAA